jgi:hypothetical protein
MPKEPKMTIANKVSFDRVLRHAYKTDTFKDLAVQKALAQYLVTQPIFIFKQDPNHVGTKVKWVRMTLRELQDWPYGGNNLKKMMLGSKKGSWVFLSSIGLLDNLKLVNLNGLEYHIRLNQTQGLEVTRAEPSEKEIAFYQKHLETPISYYLKQVFGTFSICSLGALWSGTLNEDIPYLPLEYDDDLKPKTASTHYTYAGTVVQVHCSYTNEFEFRINREVINLVADGSFSLIPYLSKGITYFNRVTVTGRNLIADASGVRTNTKYLLDSHSSKRANTFLINLKEGKI